jgi:hypothetical protein
MGSSGLVMRCPDGTAMKLDLDLGDRAVDHIYCHCGFLSFSKPAVCSTYLFVLRRRNAVNLYF